MLEQYRTRQKDYDLREREQRHLNVVQPTAQEEYTGAVDQTLDIQRLLRTLSKQDREILLLSTWEDLSSQDIAVTLGISAGTARVRLHRARQHLSEAYAKNQATPPHNPSHSIRGEKQ